MSCDPCAISAAGRAKVGYQHTASGIAVDATAVAVLVQQRDQGPIVGAASRTLH